MNNLNQLKLGKVLFKTNDVNNKNYWIDDLNANSSSSKPYFFKCGSCDEGVITIFADKTYSAAQIKQILNRAEINRIGGLGSKFNISECTCCSKRYYTGLSYAKSHLGKIVVTLPNGVGIEYFDLLSI